MTDLSIVIPFYNAETYLCRMLTSVCQSVTRYRYEVILIDDGSTDSSIATVNRFTAKHENISCFQISHGGVSRARNIGISKCTGTYVCFLDADDFISPLYIERMVGAIRSGADLIVCGYELRTGNRIRQRVLADADYHDLPEAFRVMESVKRTMVQSVWNKIFVKQTINKYGISFPENLPIGEDHSFFLDYCSRIKHIKTLSDVLYIHIKNEDSLSNKRFRYDILQKRANTIHRKNMDILSRYPSEIYTNHCSANYALDIYHSLLQLVSEDHSFKFIKEELERNRPALTYSHTYNRRQRLPLILKKALQTGSTVVLYLSLCILNFYCKIIGRRLNT